MATRGGGISHQPAEALLRERLRRLDEVERATGLGTWEWDLASDRAVWSAGMYRIFGLDSHKFQNTNENFLALVHPEDRPGLQEAMAKVLQAPGPFRQEYRLTRPDGVTRRFRGEGSHVPGSNILYGFVQDVTDAAETAHRLQETRGQFGQFFLATVLPLYIKRKSDHRIVEANPALTRLTGYAREELIDRTTTEVGIVHDPANRARMLKQLHERGHVEGWEAQLRRKSGALRNVRISLTPLVWNGEECFACSLVDDTEGRAIQAVLQATNEELEAFVYSVSHDLRAPLRSMAGFAKALQEDHADNLDADAMHDVTMVMQSAQEMQDLVDDLLALSRLGRHSMESVPLQPGQLVARLWEELAPSRAGRQVGFRVLDMPDCQADPGLLRQVYANLLQNAIKFTRLQTDAQVEAGWDGVQAAYFVRDNGVGFDSRNASKLFGPFQRLHPAHEFEGHGLGLAIVRRIVHRHGGRVWAQAEIGKGATFWFTLPVAEASVREEGTQEETQPTTQAQDSTPVKSEGWILVVDDNPQDLELTVRALRRAGFGNLRLAHDGQEALDLMGSGALGSLPSLVLLDLGLPVVPGIEVLRRLRRDDRTRNVNVAVMSSEIRVEDQAACQALGATAVLGKPFGIEALVACAAAAGLHPHPRTVAA